jgi:hypothetical protein
MVFVSQELKINAVIEMINQNPLDLNHGPEIWNRI